MTTSYRKGADFEREILRWWLKEFPPEANHYGMRSAGSKGAIDVILWDDTDVWLIQAKVDRQSLAELEAAKEALRAVPFPTLCAPRYGGNGTIRFDLGFTSSTAGYRAAYREAHREVWIKSQMRGDGWDRYEA